MREKTDVPQGTLALMVLKTLDVLGPLHGFGIKGRIEQISGDLGRLEVDFADWQVLYRQILQVGRAIQGQRQLMDLEATKAQRGKGKPGGSAAAAQAARATGYSLAIR